MGIHRGLRRMEDADASGWAAHIKSAEKNGLTFAGAKDLSQRDDRLVSVGVFIHRVRFEYRSCAVCAKPVAPPVRQYSREQFM